MDFFRIAVQDSFDAMAQCCADKYPGKPFRLIEFWILTDGVKYAAHADIM